MTEPKHTPGPWRAGTQSGIEPTTIFTHDGAIIVAKVCTSAPEPGERDANARLITASPELLADHQTIKDRAAWSDEHTLTDLRERLDDLHEIARAAIAKATKGNDDE